MNCDKVRNLLVAYLDGEVMPVEQAAIQVHLADCLECQTEMAALGELQLEVRHSLKGTADQAAPSPNAWRQFQMRLIADGKPSRRALPEFRKWLTKGGTKMKRRYALVVAVLITMGMVLLTVAFVPAVQAEISQWFGWYIPSPGGYGIIAGTDDWMSLPALTMQYVPESFCANSNSGGGEPGSLFVEFRGYSNDGLFVNLFEEEVSAGRALPEGEPVEVNGHNAVLITGLSGRAQLSSGLPQEGHPTNVLGSGGGGGGSDTSPCAPPGWVDYTDGRMLVWHQNGLYIELLTNLPEDELFRIAESMMPVEPIPSEEMPTSVADTIPSSESPLVLPPDFTPVGPDETLIFTELEPELLPEDFYATGCVTITDETTGAQISELRFYGNERFVVLVERAAVEGDTLGEGEVVMVGSQSATLESGLTGTVQLVGPVLQSGQCLGDGAGSYGSSSWTPPDGSEPLFPETIDYQNGFRLTWVTNGVRVELLTNLPHEEMLQVAETLAPFSFWTDRAGE